MWRCENKKRDYVGYYYFWAASIECEFTHKTVYHNNITILENIVMVLRDGWNCYGSRRRILVDVSRIHGDIGGGLSNTLGSHLYIINKVRSP